MLESNNKSLFYDTETKRVLNEVIPFQGHNPNGIQITSAPSLFGIFSEVSSVTMPASLPPRLENL